MPGLCWPPAGSCQPHSSSASSLRAGQDAARSCAGKERSFQGQALSRGEPFTRGHGPGPADIPSLRHAKALGTVP